MWRAISSLFTGRTALPVRTPVIALVVNEQDRRVLTDVSGKDWNVHFANSFDEVLRLASQWTAPVILFDRDWPGADWKKMVGTIAALPHRACVILVSGVTDDYLWQELIRKGGYDVLPKPLRADIAARGIKLALSYWTSAVR